MCLEIFCPKVLCFLLSECSEGVTWGTVPLEGISFSCCLGPDSSRDTSASQGFGFREKVSWFAIQLYGCSIDGCSIECVYKNMIHRIALLLTDACWYKPNLSALVPCSFNSLSFPHQFSGDWGSSHPWLGPRVLMFQVHWSSDIWQPGLSPGTLRSTHASSFI